MSPPEPPLCALLRGLVPPDVRGAVRLADGATLALGDGPPRFTLIERTPGTFARLAAAPAMLAVGEAFIDGAFDVEGDVCAAIATAYRVAAGAPGEVGGDGAGAPDVRLDGRSRLAATAAHYDLPSEFYALFLDRRMLYTCAYFPHADATLDAAQEAKLALVCRKLELAEDEAFLDVGCGWGGLLTWAAERHRVRAHGVTVSAVQARWVERAIARAGLEGRARVEHRDVYELPGTLHVDKAAALGVIEHIGVANYARYLGCVYALLRPGGLFLSQGITHATTSPRTSGMAFLDRYVFPGGDLATIGHTLDEMRRAGFEVVHVEALGPHYVPTLRAWLRRLLARRRDAVALVGERTVRIYVAYLAAAAVAFEAAWIDVYQVLLRRPAAP